MTILYRYHWRWTPNLTGNIVKPTLNDPLITVYVILEAVKGNLEATYLTMTAKYAVLQCALFKSQKRKKDQRKLYIIIWIT